MSAITTHVLDTARGQPAHGVRVTLEARHPDGWRQLACAHTDADGRVRTLLPADAALASGIYRLTFDTASYFAAQTIATLYPEVVIVFQADAAHGRYHVPLLISPFGYSTYRGS